jgi:hypothetical protein
MRTAYVVSIIFFARFLAAAVAEPRNDGDISWQKWLGQFILTHHELPRRLGAETYTAAGAAWVPQEWAIGVAVALADSAHAFWLLAVAASLCGVAVILIAARTAQLRGATTSGVLLTAILCGFGILGSFGVRAQVAGWLAFAVVLYLDTKGDRARRWAPLAILLWANLHASAPLGVAFLAMRAAFDRTRGNVIIAAAAFLALLCTPLGAAMPIYALDLLHAPFKHWINEWQPTTIDLVPAAGVFVAIIILMLRGLPQRRFDAALSCGTVIFAFIAARNVPLATIVLAPIAAARLTSTGWTLPTLDAARPRLVQIGISLAVAGVAATGIFWHMQSLSAFKDGSLPFKAMDVAAATGPSRLFCEDFAWCGLALGRPGLRTFLDGRCDPFPAKVWNDYVGVLHAGPKWSEILTRTKTDLVLTWRDRPLAQLLKERKEWRVLYADKQFELFGKTAALTKRAPSNAGARSGHALATAARRRAYLATARFEPNARAAARSALR